MKKIILVGTFVALLLPHSALTMSQTERVEDAHAIISIVTQQYGPLKWKEENLGINFNDIAKQLIAEAKDAATDKDFYSAVSRFLSALQDAHVSYEIPSSYSSHLPFATEYFTDGVVITNIRIGDYCTTEEIEKEAADCRKNIPFKVGDKVVAFDGIPVEQVIDELAAYKSDGHIPTNRKIYGTYFLTHRSQTLFPDVPKGSVKVTVVDQSSGEQKDVVAEWKTSGFELAEVPPKSSLDIMAKAMLAGPAKAANNGPADPSPESEQDGDFRGFIDRFNNSHYVDLGLPSLDKADALIGASMPFFPLWDDFEVRMKSPYYVGVFSIGDKKVGLVRIRSWRGTSYDARIISLEKEIEYLNNNTDAIIIDQTNNGGGNSCYMNRIASFFIFEPKDEIRFQVRANRTWLSWMEGWYEGGMGEGKAHAKVWLDGLREAVMNGNYLSDPIPDCSPTGKVMPYRNKYGNLVLYTKPVLVLINELDFSASDMFAAVMQDWGAAKLFGTRTAGAGGNVIGAWPIGNSEIGFRLTQSLMYRVKPVTMENGKVTNYVENVGVYPDIFFETTMKDSVDGYKEYRKAVEDAVLGLTDGAVVPH